MKLKSHMKMISFFLGLILTGSLLIAQTNNEQQDTPSAEQPAQQTQEQGTNAEQPAAATQSQEAPDAAQPADSGAKVFSDGKETYANSRAKFEIKSTDTEIGVDYIEYRIDDGQYQKYTESFNLQGDGPHQVAYVSVDKAGNRENYASLSVIIDDTAPQITLQNKGNVYRAGETYFSGSATQIEINAVDNLSGLKSLVYRVNGGDFQDYKGLIAVNEEGTFTIEYQATDNLENKTPIYSYGIVVDKAAPVVAIKSVKPLVVVNDIFYCRKDNGIKIEAVDSGSGLSKMFVKLDDKGDFVAATDLIFFDKGGEHKISAKAIDNVGNESGVTELKIYVDENPPKTTIAPMVSNP